MFLSNNSKHYCYQKAAPRGSAFYYSLRQLAPSQRDAVVAVQAFYQEVESILLKCTDLGVAQTQYSWWQNQLEKMVDGQADHPVIIELQKTLPKNSVKQLSSLLDGIEQTSQMMPFATFEDVVIHTMHTAGLRELIMVEQRVSAELVYQLTLVIELVRWIQHLRYYVRHGLIYFADDELKRFGITDGHWQNDKTTDEIKKLLHYQVEKVERAYMQAQAELTNEERKWLSSLLVRCHVACVTLREIAASQFCVMENLIDLTPLRKWWIAVEINVNAMI